MTGSRACGRWPDPSRTVSAPSASSASRAPEAQGPDRVVAPVDHEHRAIDAGAELAHALLVLEPRCQLRRDQRLRVRLEPPADAVLALLRRVRLGEALREEELEEVLVVLEPVVAVPLLPAVVVVARLARTPGSALGRGVRRRQRQSRRDEDHACRPAPGGSAASSSDAFRAARERHEHRALGAGCVHDRERIGGELLLAVGVGLGRTIRAAVAAPVEREHAAVPREVGDLHLPVARVDDRPGRQEEDRRLARAVDLVEEPHAVALDVALVVGIAGPRLLARGRARQLDGHRVLLSSQRVDPVEELAVPGLDPREPLEHDPLVERVDERDERLERQVEPELARGPERRPRSGRRATRRAPVRAARGARGGSRPAPAARTRSSGTDDPRRGRPSPSATSRETARPPRTAARCRSISRSVKRSSTRTSSCSTEPK